MPIHVQASLEGRGLPLIPSLLAPAPMVNIDPARPPIIIYPARGAAVAPPPTASAVPELLGRGRARVLAALGEPQSTLQLAAMLELTPAAVSHHLGVLHRAGLVHRSRRGRWVLYSKTTLADDLHAASNGRSAEGNSTST